VRTDKAELAELTRLAEAGDVEALRTRAIPTYYSTGLKLDRHRMLLVIALEARAAATKAA
jgi:hypothetical protein